MADVEYNTAFDVFLPRRAGIARKKYLHGKKLARLEGCPMSGYHV